MFGTRNLRNIPRSQDDFNNFALRVAFVLWAVAVIVLLMDFCRADAVQLEPANRAVTTQRVTYTEWVVHDGAWHLYYELNNGASYRTFNRVACSAENRPRVCESAFDSAPRRPGW